ncbi:triose-phosphate isomerase [bacterium]|nr:triose-phosphate isomerase [candidate division CSSED10-310 bacterium]
MAHQKRKLIIAGNWKMHMGPVGTRAFIKAFVPMTAASPERELIVFPPFISLPAALEAARGTHLRIGAQNMHHEESGAYTGEISPVMLRELGCTHVILGHSERRHVFGESDAFIHRKVIAALAHSLSPVLCIGELLAEREAGRTMEVVQRQLDMGLAGLDTEQLGQVILAYEPVWAIGTGKTATPEIAQEVHAFVRWYLDRLFGPGAAAAMSILYGGSVKRDNAAGLIAREDIDGFLVGGASLKPEDFCAIAAVDAP